MAITPKQLGQAAITTGVTTLYTVPGSTTTILKSFDICNTGKAAIKGRLFLVPNAGSAATDTAMLYDYSIPGNGLFGWEGEHVLATGATIQIQASATGLTITADGVEVT